MNRNLKRKRNLFVKGPLLQIYSPLNKFLSYGGESQQSDVLKIFHERENERGTNETEASWWRQRFNGTCKEQTYARTHARTHT